MDQFQHLPSFRHPRGRSVRNTALLPAAGKELPPPPPQPVPPQYHRLKDLHLEIPFVQAGTPTVAIVAPATGEYQDAATVIPKAIEKRTNAKTPIISDDCPGAAVPIRGNLIVLGNRSTNKTISARDRASQGGRQTPRAYGTNTVPAGSDGKGGCRGGAGEALD
jgi:hypothetical protein